MYTLTFMEAQRGINLPFVTQNVNLNTYVVELHTCLRIDFSFVSKLSTQYVDLLKNRRENSPLLIFLLANCKGVCNSNCLGIYTNTMKYEWL